MNFQSFSPENFRTILDVMNRKGVYLEDKDKYFDYDYFKESREKSEEIVKLNSLVKNKRRDYQANLIDSESFYLFKESVEEQKEIIKEEREVALCEIFKKICTKVVDESFKINIAKGETIYGKQLYETPRNAEDYFTLKQIQFNIYKTFKIKQSDRNTIMSQLTLLLSDGFPKIVIRTDIKEFYESIPHTPLMAKIDDNSLLNFPTKKIIKEILNQYWKIIVADGVKNKADYRVGVPRGIGISAYLSELYMRDLDKNLKSIPNVTFYARYVDDIVIIITPSLKTELKKLNEYKQAVKNVIRETGLEVNEDKTLAIDLRNIHSKPYTGNLTYLGYKIKVGYCWENEKDRKGLKRKLDIQLSDNKMERYKKKILFSFYEHSHNQLRYAGKGSAINNLLYNRIKYLTSNTKLVGRKSHVYVGVRFSNSYLTNPLSDLVKLDHLLKKEINLINCSDKFRAKMNLLSFETGFIDKTFAIFGAKGLERILKIWKNI